MSIRLGKFPGFSSFLFSRLVRLYCQPRFVTRCRILMHDALLDRFVDHRNGDGQHLLDLLTIPRIERRAHFLDVRSDLGFVSTINNASLLTLSHALFR